MTIVTADLSNLSHQSAILALLREAECIARDRGYGPTSLEVRVDNPTAQHLYQTQGFQDCDPPMMFWKKQL